MRGIIDKIGKQIKGLALVITMGVFLLSPQETFAEESTDENGIKHEEVSGGVKTLVEFQNSLKELSIEELEKIKQDAENKGTEEDKEYIPYIEIELENKRELEKDKESEIRRRTDMEKNTIMENGIWGTYSRDILKKYEYKEDLHEYEEEVLEMAREKVNEMDKVIDAIWLIFGGTIFIVVLVLIAHTVSKF